MENGKEYLWKFRLMVLLFLFVSLLGITENVKAAERFLWPVPNYTNVSQSYSSEHRGTDISQGGIAGKPVVATKSGIVVDAKDTCNCGDPYTPCTCNGRQGNYVIIKHNDGGLSRYLHLQYGSVLVRAGQSINRGDQIGLVGSSGESYGYHLHFDLATGSVWNLNNRYDPMTESYDYNNDNFISYLETPANGANYSGSIRILGYALHKNGLRNVTAWVNGQVMDCPMYNSPDVAAAYPGYPTGKEGFKTEIPLSCLKDGENEIGIYAYENDDTPHLIASHKFNYKKDKVSPCIKNIRVSEVSEAGYKITCNIYDNIQLDYVKCITWTPDLNAQDDWYEEDVKITGTSYDFTYYVKTDDHNNEKGRYATHLYVYDAAGNCSDCLTNANIGEENWAKPVASKIYNGHTYILYDKPFARWSTAKTYCDSLGVYLVTITSEEEQNIVEELMKSGSKDVYWIGSTDQYIEGQWTWVTAEEFTYSNWNSFEPNDLDGTQDYGVINYPSGKWGDAREEVRNSDGTSRFGFICEIEKSKKYTITYHLNGGANNPSNPAEYSTETTFLSLKDPSRDYYEFDGWYLSETWEEEFTSETSCSGDITLYAKWKPIEYTVSFDVNGGDELEENPIFVNYETKNYILPTPTREGYTFVGWYDSKENGSKVSNTDKPTSNQIYYAHWTTNSYQVSYDGNGGQVSGDSVMKVNYDQTYGTPPDVCREGYDFVGWFTEKSNGEQITPESTVKIASDHTLYAHWQITEDNPGETEHKHVYIETVLQSSTCVKDGILQHKCEDCGDYYTSVIPATGHKKLITKFAKEASCKSEGYTGDIFCQNCGNLIQEGEVIEKLDHLWNSGVIIANATDISAGKKLFTCMICGKTRTESIEKETDSKNHTGNDIKIFLSGTSKQIAEGKKIKLTVNVIPAQASLPKLIWSTSNPKVATVTQTGVVTVKKKTGGKSVTITATASDGSGISASWKIKSMKGVVKKIVVTGAKNVKAGKSLKLKAKVTATKGANKKLKWTSSNTKYATVTSSGTVKTFKAGKGKKVKITAMATDGSSKKKTVTIKMK